MLKVGNRVLSIEATYFLYNTQQSEKQLPDPDYSQILDKLNLTAQLEAKSAAKRMIKTIKNKSSCRQTKNFKTNSLKELEFRMSSSLAKVHSERKGKSGNVSTAEGE